MIELSDIAASELEHFFSGRTKDPIRVYTAMSCHGQMLTMALDEVRPGDESETVSDFTFCYSKELVDLVEGVSIDCTSQGFILKPKKPLPQPENAGGGCGGCCGGCGGN